jgi:hypothetical protein
MTELQMSLIGGAVVFVGAVFVYNKWQERKARKTVERAFSSEHDDVLMRTAEAPAPAPASPRQEPKFDLAGAGGGAGGSGGGGGGESGGESYDRIEPDVADTVIGDDSDDGDGNRHAAAELATSLVDPLIDCLIPLALEAAARGDKLLPLLHTLRHVGNKPIHYIGLAVSGDWEAINRGGVYTKLQAGVQMASRTTALNELEYSELVTRLRTLADDIGAEPEIPDMIEVMGEAKTLHRFVAGHDAQLGVNLMSNGAPWAISTLIGALEKQGFDVGPSGRYAMPDGDGGVLFTLSTNVTLGFDTTSRLTLLLDVPVVAPARDGFGSMVACARALVGRLDATIVDDSGQPLSDEALAEINGQVLEFYEEMAAADIPAGSTRALRLFS